MKLALALLAIVATSTAYEIPNFGRGELHKDIQEFLDLMPVDQIVSITVQYLTEDEEFQRMITYFQSDEFRGLVADVEGLSEVRTLMNYIHHAGIDIYRMVNALNDLLGLARLTPPDNLVLSTYKITGGIRGYIADIKAILPVKELQALYKKKLETSKAFADFIAQLKSDNFQQIVNKVYANPKFQHLLDRARKVGINLKAIKDLLETIFGIHVPDS